MKSSNTQVMVEAYRMLVNRLQSGGFKAYPLHLGVTEAGEAEDGRIKSAVGIATLLEDGLGDTVRVSLTEEPEFEIPVARALVDRYKQRHTHKVIKPIEISPINPFEYSRRITHEVYNLGASNVPRVVADFSNFDFSTQKFEGKASLKHIGHYYFDPTDKWNMTDTGADYLYTGSNQAPFMLPMGIKEIIDYEKWNCLSDKKHKFPLLDFTHTPFKEYANYEGFIKVNYKSFTNEFYTFLHNNKNIILLLETQNQAAMPALRRLFFYLLEHKITHPVVVTRNYESIENNTFSINAAADLGGLLLDGFGDGIMISANLDYQLINQTAFGVLQAARTRMSKTEYISCPSCGRTLFDLQETTAMIRKRTDHLKGLKIGIMGCIVNGPGEMADADFGYVGVGKDRIALYKGKEVIKKSVLAENALDELIEIIKENGKWVDAE